MAWVRARFCRLQKWYTRFTVASDKVYQLLANGLWFFPGSPASSTTKIGRHDIAEILLKVALNTVINQSISNLRLFIIPSQAIIVIPPCYVNKHMYRLYSRVQFKVV